MAEQARPIGVYGCKCGEVFDDRKDLFKHFWRVSKKEKGQHASLGILDPITHEVIMPPWNQRTDEQKAATCNAFAKQKKIKVDGNGNGSGSEEAVKTAKTVRTTDVLADASQLKFIPKVFNTTYTPIMMNAQHVAQVKWGWPDMSLEDFLDTIIYKYCKEHGVILMGYFEVDENGDVKTEGGNNGS